MHRLRGFYHFGKQITNRGFKARLTAGSRTTTSGMTAQGNLPFTQYYKVISERNKVAGLLPLHPFLTFFERSKKVNKETRRLTISASSWKSALIRADIRHLRAIRKNILGSLANSLPCRQVKQARLKESKNTFAHNRPERGMKIKIHL